MKAFIIATDDERPKKSALLVGPEHDDDEVRRRFYAYRTSGVHPAPWKRLELWNQNGFFDRSVARSFEPTVEPIESADQHRRKK